jgi:hypothetical protein
MLFYLLLRRADSIKKTFPFFFFYVATRESAKNPVDYYTISHCLFIHRLLPGSPSLSSLTAGWKNGWQKSVRE